MKRRRPPPPTCSARRIDTNRRLWHANRRLVGRCLVCFLACAAMSATLVMSERAYATTATDRRAVELTAQAKTAFRAGQFQQAAMLFQRAYAEVPEPTLLFNAARAYQNGAFLREALSMFRLYLTLATYDDDDTRAGRAEAVQYIATIDKTLQRQEEDRARAARAAATRAASPTTQPVQPASPTTPTATTPTATTAAATTAAATTPAATTPTATTPTATTPGQGARPSSPGNTPPSASSGAAAGPSPAISTPLVLGGSATKKPVHRPGLFSRVSKSGWTEREIAAVSLMGGGAAIVLTGVILHVVANATLSGLDDDLAAGRVVRGGVTFYGGLTQRAAQGVIDSANGLRLGGNMLVGLGAVALGVGGWLWLDRRLDGDHKLSFAPQLGPHGFGWALQGRF